MFYGWEEEIKTVDTIINTCFYQMLLVPRWQSMCLKRSSTYIIKFWFSFMNVFYWLECVLVPVQGASLSSEPDPPVVYEGEPLVLRCLVSRGTHLSFMWYHNRQEVTSSPSELYRLSENTLTVDRAGEQHAGIYSCTAQNQMDVNTRYSSSRNLEVIVKSKNSSVQHQFNNKLHNSHDESKLCWKWFMLF